ncbi:MAG: Bifunctional protein GlmU [Candidatus Roizmanbacteria bacterium GW2011_GWA2_34_18]|uniref:Bifunctional protein GlmU n=1 Tax=Candidatus Roizmanbacteria bacterium GW2011_GWA2_34_18 TaxID=1618477 RepID=A0A0G0D982_9BACT|nr:MAG: Bifunctional protein GlmU [Candidatus Roizmanbacteria bacterium GW2011_GWA2_34_18]
MRKIRNILLLAGGDSTRFWPLENKLFFSFLGKPLILFQIEELLKYSELVTVVANKSNSTTIKRLIDNVNLKPVQILVQKEDYPGMAGAVFSAKNHIKGEALVVNGSDLIDYSIISKLSLLINQENKLILMGKKFNEYFPGGYFKFTDNKKVIEVVEKPAKDKLPSSIVKLVFDYFADINILLNHFSQIKTKNDDFYELAVNKLLSDDLKQSYFLYDSYWFGLKYPWQVLMMMKNFLLTIKESKISTTAIVSKGAIIVGPVVIGDNVKIGDFCKIVGPTFINDNSVIGDYSMVRESQIGQDCLVGSYCEVARSYIGNNVFLHRNYIGDSVLDNDVMFGAQAVTGNLRFNGEKIPSLVNEEKMDTNMNKLGAIVGKLSKVGINATILPGVKIGKETWIGPGEVVKYDVDDKTYLANGEEKINLKV